MKSKSVLIVILIILALCFCASFIVLCVVASGITMTGMSFFEGTPTPSAPIHIVREPLSEAALETYQTLLTSVVPENDMRELASRLGGQPDVPLVMEQIPVEYQPGDQSLFWITNTDTNENFQVNAILQYKTDHAYFWIEDGVDFNPDELEDLAITFEEQIYPTNREFFGTEWLPGIDQDPRLYILYTSNLGYSLGGYFSTVDELHPLAHEYSNAHEMFLLSADNLRLGDEFTYGVLAHEFQHMIHWFHDRNEFSWVNEGFSELAAQINGYDPGGFDLYFSNDADIQLTDWPNDSNAALPHYGASFLFMTYFMDRFGEEATKAVVAAQENGMESLDTVFLQMNLRDSLTGEIFSADEVFRDWTIANYLQDSAISDGRFAYYSYDNTPVFYEAEYLNECNIDWQERSVSQYGTDYIKFNCREPFTLTFEGSTEVSLFPANTYSGEYAFWSNKGDQSDMTLTHHFDFSDVLGPVSFQYHVWYDLEKDYDYLYLEISEDSASWEILEPPSCSKDDISGNSYGCGYNGNSGGWFLEEIDLSEYAGKKVWLRFEYITDAVANGEGLLLDDVSIPQIDYWTDFEVDNGGWEENGFVRVQNRIPQTYLLSLITKGEQTEVRNLTLNPDESLSTFVNVTPGMDGVILVVSGNARYTRIPAVYRFKVEQ